MTFQNDNPDSLSQRNFLQLASFIENYSGIKVPLSKVTMIEGRLRRRVRATGLPNLKQYCNYLFEKDGLAVEAVQLIDAVTTNKTEFFREPEHFRFLAEHAVPQLLSGSRGRAGASLKIWSAACSIGAEPYTAAMVLADLSHQISGLRYTITATDICTEVLDTAISGIYPEAMIQPVPPDVRQRYVLRSKDRTRHQVRIVPELRAATQFARINLMEVPYSVDRDMDVIFCRNILIYFDKPTQETVLQRLCEHLRPGGFLFLGHSEALTGFVLPLRPAAPTVFRRL
ncbi:MAG: protein-glutamate O-methyltransferase [Acetobacteraceae bacterium]|nr:protein-glutamate O-methyltransferase [Acetobacteraceae bacterium]